MYASIERVASFMQDPPLRSVHCVAARREGGDTFGGIKPS